MGNNDDLKPSRKRNNLASSYAQYSGIAIQMIVILLLFTYLGQWLDSNYGGEQPYFTIVTVLIGISLALYLPLKSLLR